MIARNDDVDRRLHVLEDEHGAGDIEAMVRLGKSDAEHESVASGFGPGTASLCSDLIQCRQLTRQKPKSYG
ncbi:MULTISPECIES: hypothetical protein [Sphingomonadaceae]|uniref:hypothetical protein n=1 Tax=Sphingomonadales TaxID=204457 RepID=UPI001C8BB761|nr:MULTISPECIES: hypothetical protein [Sphingomonadaceae]MDG2514787.1 hypothetical protein [Sphingobium yanoikuyae]